MVVRCATKRLPTQKCSHFELFQIRFGKLRDMYCICVSCMTLPAQEPCLCRIIVHYLHPIWSFPNQLDNFSVASGRPRPHFHEHLSLELGRPLSQETRPQILDLESISYQCPTHPSTEAAGPKQLSFLIPDSPLKKHPPMRFHSHPAEETTEHSAKQQCHGSCLARPRGQMSKTQCWSAYGVSLWLGFRPTKECNAAKLCLERCRLCMAHQRHRARVQLSACHRHHLRKNRTNG